MQLASRRLVGGVYVLSGAIAGVVSFALGQSRNLEVFRHASRALLAGRDLYDGSSVDWFKYSPTFALLFLPLAILPAWLSSALWGALNFGAAFIGIDAAARDDTHPKRGGIAALAALPGILLATDGDQANLLVAGAMLVAFAAFERGRSATAAVAVAAGALVKIFPVAAALLAFPHRDRERFLFRVIVALGCGVLLPLVVLSPRTLQAEYSSWLALLGADHATRGWSLVTVVRDLGASGLGIQIGAAVALACPLVLALVVPVDARFRRRCVAAMLIAIVLGNHRSEYTSFVLTSIGVGLWFAEGRATAPRIGLLVLASIAHGPLFVRNDPTLGGPLAFLAAHRLFHSARLVPSALVWLLLQASLARSLRLGFLRIWRSRQRAEA